MKPRFSLFTKVLFLAFANLFLLGLVFALFARLQFRLDAGSFLLAPAQNRIMAVAHTLALELDDMPPSSWDQIVTRYAQANHVTLLLLNEEGERVAGPDLPVAPELLDRIPRHDRPPGPRPPRERERRRSGPPMFLDVSRNPTRYWAGVRIPVRLIRGENPKPGTLVFMTPSLMGTQLFFDPKPWLAVVLAVILVSMVCWLPFIRGMTRSIREMTRAASQIAEGRFEVHVADRRSDEIGQLGGAINRMASRLSGFVHGQKRFLGGIAHELCNPLATIQFALGGLARRVSLEEGERVADIEEEVQHMSDLVNELLSFSRAGIEGVDIKLVSVSVAATVTRAIERESSPEQQIEAAVDDKLKVLAEPEYLFRAVSNLIRNAIRYAAHAGPIRISTRQADGKVYLTVTDQGPGVPESALEEIFAPFYRVDASRNQETGGVGLGLAIVKACIEACHGSVHCRNRKPNGLEVEIELTEVTA